MKKGQAQVAIIVLLVILILVFLPTGLNYVKDYVQKDHTITISTEDESYDFGSRIKLFYEVENKGDLTLISKVSIKTNETCFYETDEKELNEIPPSKTEKSYVYIESRSNRNLRETCFNRTFDILAELMDTNGAMLDSNIIQVNITR